MTAFIKRSLDILLSAVAILTLSPLLIVTAMVLKLTGEHRVLYRQQRIGRNDRPFNVYKFVTMSSGSETHSTITCKNDPRILPFGRLLRKAEINELPQLFNILFGHMSVVGPRPLPAGEVAMYPEVVRSRIYAGTRPGLSGVGSLFFRNEDELLAATGKPPERAYREDILPIKGALELWYSDHKTLWLDVKIVLLTVWVVLHPSSAPLIAAFGGLPDFPVDALRRYQRLRQRSISRV